MDRVYIGILFDNNIYKGIPKRKTKYENLEFYEEAGRKYGLTPCYFRLRDISPEKEHIFAYVKNGRKYKKMKVPTPKVIQNRAYTFNKKAEKKINRLLDAGKIIFNQNNRLSKLTIHEMLLQNEALKSFLPQTLLLNYENLFHLLSEYQKVIIKPVFGSLGIGVMLVEQSSSEYVLSYVNRKEKKVETTTFTDELPNILLNAISSKSYLVQERIELLEYEGNPFDLRVTVQRDDSGEWQVTGIVGKVATHGSYVTNVARGGKVLRLEELLNEKMDMIEVKRAIDELSLSIATELEKKIPWIADLGLDIGLTADGKPMFIECNRRALRRTYKYAGMMEVWRATHENPIGYGKFLIGSLDKASSSLNSRVFHFGVLPIELKFAETKDGQVLVSKSLWQKWDLSSDQLYTISFGNKNIETTIKPVAGDGNQVILNAKNAAELTIPFPKQIQAKIDGKEIRLGPLIGLLTAKKNGNAKLLKQMLSYKERNDNYTFIFTQNDIDWPSKTIKGTLKSAQNSDEYFQTKVPIPDVIYNQLFGRRRENSKEAQTLLKNLKQYTNTKIFNPYFFDKKTIHTLLEDNNEVTKYLPKTIFAPSRKDIAKLLNEYSTVFLKPRNGLGGRGIYKIEKSGDYYISNTERTVTKYDNLSELLRKIKWRRKYKNYLAQEGISLIKLHGRQVDFRVNINKNIRNKWIVAAIAGKAAGDNSVTTHIRLGGEIYSGIELLETIFKEQSSSIINDMEEAVISLALAIESGLNTNVGEIGFDMGVDVEGRVWMFEANSKPGRSIFKHPSFTNADNHSLTLLFDYAYYLSRFT